MEKIQEIQKAKSYLEMLAHSINPITREEANDQILQNQEIKDMFIFVSTLLDELIKNNGEVVRITKPAEFNPAELKKWLIQFSEEPVQIKTLTDHINRQIDTDFMKKLGPSKITNWLTKKGYLKCNKVAVAKIENQFDVTEESQKVGIITKQVSDKQTGELKTIVYYTKDAQNFIVDNLSEICADDKRNNSDIYDTDCTYISNTTINMQMQGQKWSSEEEKVLIEEFQIKKYSISEIAENHQRSSGGVIARLKKLGLID